MATSEGGDVRVWQRPDGTLVIRDGDYGSDVLWLDDMDQPPADAVPLLATAEIEGEAEHPAVRDDWPLVSSHITDRLQVVKETVASLEPWPVRAASPQGEARGQDPGRSWTFHLGEAVVDVGWEGGEPYVIAMDGREELINADDHNPATLLDAFRVLHGFLARVTPLRADVAFPDSAAPRAVAPVANVDRETLNAIQSVIDELRATGSTVRHSKVADCADRLVDALAALRDAGG